jgi:hypothetical protein
MKKPWRALNGSEAARSPIGRGPSRAGRRSPKVPRYPVRSQDSLLFVDPHAAEIAAYLAKSYNYHLAS